jgi:hypothetical protein
MPLAAGVRFFVFHCMTRRNVLEEDKSIKRGAKQQRLPDPAPGQPGRTTERREREAEPRLPHEHDESADSQSGGPRPEMRQAHADLERGVVDTDRGVPMEEIYDRELRTHTPEKPADAGKRKDSAR